MHITIISSSLNKKSRGRVMADFAGDELNKKGIDFTLIDLREYDIPFCDGAESYDHPHVKEVKKILKGSQAVIIATPIYNYAANAAIKNLIELTGSAWKDKPVGFLCKAGGQRSYMSVMGLANSLMFDFRCIIVPRFVYALSSDFHKNESITDNEIVRRISELVNKTVRLAEALEE